LLPGKCITRSREGGKEREEKTIKEFGRALYSNVIDIRRDALGIENHLPVPSFLPAFLLCIAAWINALHEDEKAVRSGKKTRSVIFDKVLCSNVIDILSRCIRNRKPPSRSFISSRLFVMYWCLENAQHEDEKAVRSGKKHDQRIW
jgi:hypothetical protein